MPWQRSFAAKYTLVIAILISGGVLTSSVVQTYFAFQERQAQLILLQREKAAVAAARIERFLLEIGMHMDWTNVPGPPDSPPGQPAGPGQPGQPPPAVQIPPGAQPPLPGSQPPPPPPAIPDERRAMDLGRLLRQAGAVTQASFLDASGQERARAVREGPFAREMVFPDGGSDLSREPPFASTRTGQPFHSPVYFRGPDQPRFTTSVRDGASRGAIVVEVDLRPVRDLVAGARPGRSGAAYLLDSRGQLIAHSELSGDPRDADYSRLPQVVAALKATPTPAGQSDAGTTLIVPNADGKQVLSAFQRIEPIGWTVFVEQPVEEAFAPIVDLLWRTGVLLVAGLLISLAASLVLARRMATPIQKLRAGAMRLGAGALDQRIEIHTGDELQVLADEFNHMAAQLQDSYATLERRVQERTQELSETLVDLAAARDQALDATRTKSAFLASMSHELRTPLNAIIGFTEVLTDSEMPVDEATRAEFLQDVLNAGRHLLQLINDILDLSKVEAGKMEFVPEEFDLPAAIHGVEAVARSLTERKHQRLEVMLDPAISTVFHDPARFKQVLFNLVSNAVKFTPDGGTIRVTARRDSQGWLEIAVIDTGIGIKLEHQAVIFEEFRQIDSGYNREQQGTGLGLALVRRFVQAMGGEIWVESAPGQGATFTFRIPMRQRVAIPAAATGPAATVVVVVEDNPQAIALLDFHLTRGGYHVERASDVDLAWEKIVRLRPAAITLDLQLPEAPDGWELLRRLKREASTRDIPVIVISVLDNASTSQQLGAACHLLKPVDPHTLLETIERLIQHQPQPVTV